MAVQTRFPKIVFILLMFSSLLGPSVLFALPFSIAPAQTLPSTLSTGQLTTAFYTVQNNSNKVLSGNALYSSPVNVTQITSNADYPYLCKETFTLQPKHTQGDACTLQLLINGPINGFDSNPLHHLFICMPGNKTCVGTNTPLNVTMIPVVPIIAVAGFTVDANSMSETINIQTTATHGASWIPHNIIPANQHAQVDVNGISCDEGACMASITHHDAQNNNFPGVLASANNGNTWLEQSLNLPDGFSTGQLLGIDCHATTCRAVGAYTSLQGNTQPAIATSTNTGATWSQQTLALPIGYNIGQMKSITCSGNNCLGAGYYYNGTTLSPGIIKTMDGTTWDQQILTISDPQSRGGELNGVSCTDTACLAAGFYVDNQVYNISTIYTSTDMGSTWSQQDVNYPSYTDSFFNAIHCTHDFCVAAGFASNRPLSNEPHKSIVAMFDANGTLQSQQTLPLLAGYTSCDLNGIQCEDRTCIAAGACISESIDQTSVQYIATSSDSGATWSQQIMGTSGPFIYSIFNAAG